MIHHDSSLFPRMEVFERKWPSPRRVPPAKQLGPLGALSKAQDRSDRSGVGVQIWICLCINIIIINYVSTIV